MSINKLNFQEKQTGDILEASEWNQTVSKIDELVDASNNGGNGGGSGNSDPHIVFDERSESNPTGKSNLTIETTANDQYQDGNKTKGGKINIEPISDLQIKPGDDISLCSHHREDPTEVSVKVLDGNDNPVKLQLNAANIVLTTKDKNKTKTKDANGDDTNTALYDDPTVMNITVNSAKNTKGYLKVRAQAIDLRCEDHGGIALQPKGDDGEGHENKIKFEHNGGDGKEFGTFNTQKTSIFTDQYRFNKSGIVYPVTRGALETTYKIDGDPTSGVKKIDYPTQADDFKDILDNNKYCTWEDIVAAGQGCSVNDKGLTIKNNKNTTNVGPIAEANFGNVLLYTQFYAKPLAKGANTDALDDSIDAIQNPENVPNAKQTAQVATTLQLPSDTDIEADAAAILANFPVNTSEIYTAKEIIEKFYTYANAQYVQEQLKLAYEQGKYIKFSSRGASVIFQPIYKELELSSGFINYPVNYAQAKQDGDIRVKVSDIAKLVTWMKTNNQGPWAAQ